MRIIRAKAMGMCFGVRDAISLALTESRQRPVTVLGELVHNKGVLTALRQQGVRFQDNPNQIPTSTVMITAHGASEKAMGQLRAQGLNVLEATCPLVHHAHRVVQRLVQENYHPVIIGKRDHVEVRGMTEDLADYDVVLTEEDIDRLPPRPRFGVAAQTTQPMTKVLHLIALLRRRFPHSEVRFEDTVCQPTKQRQAAAVELAEQCDVVVVVGGANSNNTRELVETCRRACNRVYHVQSAADLSPAWFVGAEVAGITAGTSTPDGTIDEVERWLESLNRARRAASAESQPDHPLEPSTCRREPSFDRAGAVTAS